MTDMPLLMHFIYSFISSIGFAIFLNAPKSTLPACGLTGGVGWAVYYYIVTISNNDLVANFFAAVCVSLLSEILARKLKQPAIVFVIPGIILLVPGLGMYNTMLYLVQNNYALAVSKGADTLFIGCALSMGVLIITSLFRTINLIKTNKGVVSK